MLLLFHPLLVSIAVAFLTIILPDEKANAFFAPRYCVALKPRCNIVFWRLFMAIPPDTELPEVPPKRVVAAGKKKANEEAIQRTAEQQKLQRFKDKESKFTEEATKMALNALELRVQPSKSQSPIMISKFKRLSNVYKRLLRALHELEIESKQRAKEFVVTRVAQLASGDDDSLGYLNIIQSIRDEEIEKNQRLVNLALSKEEPNGLQILTVEEMQRVLLIRGNVKNFAKITRRDTVLAKLEESYRRDLY